MQSQGHMGAPLYHDTDQVTPSPLDLRSQGQLRSGNDATTPLLRLISTSDQSYIHIRHTQKCLRHWFAVSREYGGTLIPYTCQVGHSFGESGHVRSGNDDMTSWLRLIFNTNHFIQPYKTYTKCLRHWFDVSGESWCSLISLQRPSLHQIWEVRLN